MVFDDEHEYVRFVKYVYTVRGGRGLELTNLPIVASVRVRRWLWDRLQEGGESFAMRPVTEADLLAVRTWLQGRRPFAPENLEDFRVPGIPVRARST
jgi:hypothetical protein